MLDRFRSIPRENIMKTRSTHPFKQQLLRQREALMQQLEQLRGGASRIDAASEILTQQGDPHAQVFSERELELILDDRETAEERAIDAALERIELGTFGQCLDCGVDIPEQRLMVAPEAARCVACQGKLELAPAGLN
jgi:DnaK suppressor protein